MKRSPASWLEVAVLLLLPVAVFAAALGSSSIDSLLEPGLKLRWVALALLTLAAIPLGLRSASRVPRAFVIALGALWAVALLSASWSVAPRSTVEHAVTFIALGVAALSIGVWAAGSRRRLDLVGAALLAAPVAVAIAGVAVWILDHHLAVQAANPGMPARLRGFGQDPNTSALLFGLVVPLALAGAVGPGSRSRRIVSAASLALLYGSILASGSRGAILAALAGTAVYVFVRIRPWRSAVAAEAAVGVAALLSVAVAGGRPPVTASTVAVSVPMTQPAAETRPSSPVTHATGPGASKPSRSKPGGSKPSGSKGAGSRPNGASPPAATGPRATTTVASSPAATTAPATTPTITTAPTPSLTTPAPVSPWQIALEPVVPRNIVPTPFVDSVDEIGFPGLYVYKPLLAYGSGRVYAWDLAIGQGLKRPVDGYGFGMERTVFVDRSFYYEASYAENSFVGIFLELGGVGLLLLLLLFAICLGGVVRALRGRTVSDRTVVAAASGMTAAAFVSAFFQSYLFSAGNIAALTAWTAITLTAALVAGTPATAGAAA